ncbi:MAG: hypothetical protein AAFN70_04315, partial [Planctomycetota bacterium]
MGPPLADAMPESSIIPSFPLERYFARRTHGDGMTFYFELQFQGQIDVSRMCDAWAQCLVNHPRAFYRLQAGAASGWQPTTLCIDNHFSNGITGTPDKRDQHVDTADDSKRVICDPRDGVGVHLSVVQNQDAICLQFAVHHATFDGVGVSRLVYQLLRCYAGNPPIRDSQFSRSPRPPQPEDNAEPDPTTVTAPGGAFPNLGNVWHTIRGRNLCLNAPISDDSAQPPAIAAEQAMGETAMQFQFDPSQTVAITRTLRDRREVLNDVAVAVMLDSIGQLWAPRNAHIMVMNPVQTRDFAARHDSQNRLGIAFVRRHHDPSQTFGERLTSVSAELSHVRSHGVAGELEMGIGIAERLPGALSVVEWMRWFTPTISLTCLPNFRPSRRAGFVRESMGWRLRGMRYAGTQILA